MSNFPFTHLEYLHSRHVGSLLRPPVLALQQFISLETLRTLKLDTGRILDPTILVEIWSLFPSPLLKRLKFDIPVTFEPLLSPSLNSDIDRRLLWTLYPWKLSSLKALSLLGTEVSWKELAPLIPAIEVLDFGLRPSIIDLDLASFSNLSVLRIRFVPRTTQNIHNQLREIEDLGPMLGLFLSTLRRPSQIRTFVFSCPPLHPMIAKEIDSTLSAHLLDDAATVEIEVSSNVSKIPESFPRLRARNLLRYRELTADSRGINDRSADNAWWENIVTTL
ncbi:hypothetical protein B0H16DRAFT_1600041 [Mycena metata]|uniref:Uncharacterized protein n=1 Tax=Mycena metata TaxID=1033252 RepID=A0AAD7HL86_9AGAR|nr:hypothetical protein B0H16DRAFT_1600041 [Mycena metata]